MAIHHDKMAYGKLAASREDMREDELIAMAQLLSEEEDEREDEAKKDERALGRTE